MANQEHLDIILQGVKAWNRWRRENPEITPDLSGASLGFANLSKADLSKADLSGTNLGFANLSKADLSEADLRKADLSEADLRKADLSETDLSEAGLISANLCGANLSGANLGFTNLSRADLSVANLSGANLGFTNLSRVYLNFANLNAADLSGANLTRANLTRTSFQMARLINAKLDDATLTDACLWETQRAGWSIKGVIGESVYWDKEAQVKTTYSPGDFERLFAEQTKIKLLFKDGISPLEIATLPALIKHLEETHPGSSLRLVSIHDDSGGAVVELAIDESDQNTPEQMKQLQAALESSAKQVIEYQRHALVERETRLRLEGTIEQLSTDYDKLIVRPMGDVYHISQAGAVGPQAHADHNTFNQVVQHVEQDIDLAELAKQLAELRQAIMQEASPQAAIAVGEVARAELAAGEKNTGKVVEHLKAAGKWTLDFANDIGKDLVVAVIKQAMSTP